MTLKEKLHKIYESIDAIEKRGHNKAQNYDYMKASDVTNALRKQFIDLKVYAEINFDFHGAPFTIAREKAPNAPFSAVAVKCFAKFHDLESPEVLTGSGLGTGADTSDKSAYKAQTGALKYMLKNAFLVPDEADPEADERTDELPVYRTYAEAAQEEYQNYPSEGTHPAPRAHIPKATLPPPPPAVPAAKQNQGPVVSPDQTPVTQEEPGAYEPGEIGDPTMPTEADMDEYRKKFTALANNLSTNGKLTASKGLKLNVKLRVFMQQIEGVNDVKSLTKAQWTDFFRRADIVVKSEAGLIGLAKLVNKANGIEPKK